MSTSALHLVRCSFDARRLYAFARRSRVASSDFDEGYAVHAAFAALFDHGAKADARVAPKPFRVTVSRDRLDVLGYCATDRDALAERAKAFADPSGWDLCDLDAMASKPMPSVFRSGMRVGFATKVCPVRRVSRRGPSPKEYAEVDAFLAKSWAIGDEKVSIERADVYREWLGEELAKGGAAKLLDGSLTTFRRAHVYRRAQDERRTGSRLERPVAELEGIIEIADPEAFRARLARGIGRHRAFGFGMLLLRPAS